MRAPEPITPGDVVGTLLVVVSTIWGIWKVRGERRSGADSVVMTSIPGLIISSALFFAIALGAAAPDHPSARACGDQARARRRAGTSRSGRGAPGRAGRAGRVGSNARSARAGRDRAAILADAYGTAASKGLTGTEPRATEWRALLDTLDAARWSNSAATGLQQRLRELLD